MHKVVVMDIHPKAVHPNKHLSEEDSLSFLSALTVPVEDSSQLPLLNPSFLKNIHCGRQASAEFCSPPHTNLSCWRAVMLWGHLLQRAVIPVTMTQVKGLDKKQNKAGGKFVDGHLQ